MDSLGGRIDSWSNSAGVEPSPPSNNCNLVLPSVTLFPPFRFVYSEAKALRSNGSYETLVCQCDHGNHLADAPGSTAERTPTLLRQNDQEITWRLRQVTPFL